MVHDLLIHLLNDYSLISADVALTLVEAVAIYFFFLYLLSPLFAAIMIHLVRTAVVVAGILRIIILTA